MPESANILANHLPSPYLIIFYPSYEKKERHDTADDVPVPSRKRLIIWSENRAGRRVHTHPMHTAHIHLAGLISKDGLEGG